MKAGWIEKLAVAGFATFLLGLAVAAGWNMGPRTIDPGALLMVWLTIGLVVAAMYSLS